MASVQGNPGFVKGQVPTAALWNAQWTVKQDALINSVSVTGASTVLNTCCKLTVDTSSGNVPITVPLNFGQAGKENWVRIIKKSATPNSNVVILTTDGSTEFARIINENDGGGQGYLDVYVDGSAVTGTCGVP